MASNNNSKLIITIIICTALVIVSAVGAWIYVQDRQFDQQDKALQQQKQLKEYEQEQLNQRQEKSKGGAYVDPCDIYSSC